MAPKKSAASKGFLSEEYVVDSDSDYEQKQNAPSQLKGKARAAPKSTKKRAAASKPPGELPFKHQKTFHPLPAKVRGKKPTLSGKDHEFELKDKSQLSSSDEEANKKIVERITGVMAGSRTKSSDEASMPSISSDASPPREGGIQIQQEVLNSAGLPVQKDVTDWSNRRNRNPPDLECVYYIKRDKEWATQLSKYPDLAKVPLKGPVKSPGLWDWQRNMQRWRNHIRETLDLKKYGLALSVVLAKIDNAQGKPLAEPPALPIFNKHKQTARPYQDLITRMGHGRAVKATFILKFEVGEEAMEEVEDPPLE